MHFTNDMTSEHISGLADSAGVIDSIIGDGERTDDIVSRMDRNVRHIDIMCAMPHIKDSGADLTPFIAAAARGAAWIAAS